MDSSISIVLQQKAAGDGDEESWWKGSLSGWHVKSNMATHSLKPSGLEMAIA